MTERSFPQTTQANDLYIPLLTFLEGRELQDLLYDIGLYDSNDWNKDITGALAHQENGMWDEVWLTESSHPHRLSATFHNRAYYGLNL